MIATSVVTRAISSHLFILIVFVEVKLQLPKIYIYFLLIQLLLLSFYLQYIFEYYDFYIFIYYSGTVLIYQYLFLLNTVRTLFTFCNQEEERIKHCDS